MCTCRSAPPAAGICDFNTYTPAELGAANPDGWLAAVRAEPGLAAVRLGAPPTADTVFVGGGSPAALTLISGMAATSFS